MSFDQTDNEKIDYFTDINDTTLEDSFDRMDKESELKIEINQGLETALELDKLKSEFSRSEGDSN